MACFSSSINKIEVVRFHNFNEIKPIEISMLGYNIISSREGFAL